MKDEKYYGTALPTIVPHVVEFAQAKSTEMRDLTSACPSQISHIRQIPHLQIMSIDMLFRAGRHRELIERLV